MLLLFLYVFSGGLISGVTKYLQNECHLAAKFGTRLAASLYMSSLLWVDDSHLEVTLLSLLFSVICYFHQREMISFIKLETCRLICCWLRWLLLRVLAFFNLSWEIWQALLWFFLVLHFFGYKKMLLSLCCSCFCDISWIICYLSC